MHALVLLCYKKGAPQKGQPESLSEQNLRAMVCRSVAMDPGVYAAPRVLGANPEGGT